MNTRQQKSLEAKRDLVNHYITMDYWEFDNQVEYTKRAIGVGQGRKVYGIKSSEDGKTIPIVLKVAQDIYGDIQNQVEHSIYHRLPPHLKPVVAKVGYIIVPSDYSEMTMERVSPLKNITHDNMLDEFKHRRAWNYIDALNFLINHLKSEGTHLHVPDLLKPSSWGITIDNRVVLIDYGLTTDLYVDMYENGK